MLATRNLHNQSFKSLSSLLHFRHPNVLISRDFTPKPLSTNVGRLNNPRENEGLLSFSWPRKMMLGPLGTWASRSMSSNRQERGWSMRARVERRMQRESGRTMREVRRARRIQKKLMTDNERLVFNLRRAKRKVAVLLQKLKKYELPELPQPKHDPELLTPEQLQAYKKIGFRNKNYALVGVRGVFGGVVQNMHMHWKFHETVQVCCDNFPQEKIREMASTITRLSGGIVVNIHNRKTLIMFRGRNYRQPQNLIPLNTLTKRKALFKARFEQALESQKLNIKKMEQKLRQAGINPEDPAATASIQRVANSFFNAIDNQEGTPYVFQPEKLSLPDAGTNFGALEPSDEREQAELDRFIADIEDAAEREWAAEEEAEKEELQRIRYWNKDDYAGRLRRSESSRDNRYGDEERGLRNQKQTYGSDDEDEHSGADSGSDDSGESEMFESLGRDRGNRERNDKVYRRNAPSKFRKSDVEEEPEGLSDLESAMWRADDDDDVDDNGGDHERFDSINRDYSGDLNGGNVSGKTSRSVRSPRANAGRKWTEEDYDSGDSFGNSESSWCEADAKNGSRASRAGNYMSSDDEDDETREGKRDSENWTYRSPIRESDDESDAETSDSD